MDTAGKAVLFSGVTVLISLIGGDARSEPRVSLDEPRDHARRDLRARGDTHAAARRAGQARPARSTSSRFRGRTRASTAPPGSPPGASDSGDGRLPTARSRSRSLVGLAIPVTQLKTAMPSIKVVPTSRHLAGRLPAGAGRVRTRRDRAAADRRTGRQRPQQVARSLGTTPASPRVMPTQTSNGYALVTAIPKQDPSNPAVGATIDRLRADASGRRADRRRGRREPRPRRARSRPRRRS